MKSTAEKSSTSSLIQRSESPFFSKRGEDSFFAASGVQAKLEIGQPGDAYEKEADAMAEKVMQSSAEQGVSLAGKEEEKVQKKPLAESITPIVQRKNEEEPSESPEGLTTDIQRKETTQSASPSVASPSLESQLSQSQGGGTPLPTAARQEMEAGFGSDFSSVRVHTDSQAVQLSRQLGAQAFTKGNDLYFNSGRYNPTSSEGKRLLAHELTHTIQQGKSPTVQRKLSPTSLSLQKEGETTNDADKINTIAALPEGSITMVGNSFQVKLVDFPAKQYANLFSPISGQEPDPILMPKPGTRKTNQGSIWRQEMATPIRQSLEKIVDSSIVNENLLSLKLKNLGSSNAKKTEIFGNLPALAKEIMVPFWDVGGKPTIHEIEHKIGWQVMGPKADTIDNLILLDKDSNKELGNEVDKDIKARVKKLLNHYKKEGIQSLTDRTETALMEYTVEFVSFKSVPTDSKSILSNSSLRPTSGNNPISIHNLEIKKAETPDGQFLFKTARSGAGYLVPYNFSNDFIKIEGNASTHELKSVTIIKGIKDNTDSVENAGEAVPVTFTKEKQDIYKMNHNGLAGTLKNILRLKHLSPVELNDDVELNPKTGLQATGKVKSDIPFLKDTEITFGVVDSYFVVQATITSDALKDKLPKPFSIQYSSLTLALSTQTGLTLGGEVGFGIEKVGKGFVGAVVGSKGFALEGSFNFENSQFFKKAEVGFKYAQKAWKIQGALSVEKGKIKGIESGKVTFSYDGKTLTGSGSAKLSIPGIDQVALSAKFEESGNFSITGSTKLGKIPGIKSGDATVTLAKTAAGYELSMSGKAKPDLPKIPGLATSFAVSYTQGIFKIEGTATYKKDKVNGTLTIGVTNGIVKDGKITGAQEGGKLTIYGNGKIKITLIKEIIAELEAEVDPQGEISISGAIKVDATPFEKVSVDKSIFKIAQQIPLVGVPFANINLVLGADANFYFNWKPLRIELETTLAKTKLDDIGKGEMGGALMATLSSEAEAGVKLGVRAGVGATLTVITVSGNITGSVGLGLGAKMQTQAAATWNAQKGLQLQSVEAALSAEPEVKLELAGDIRVELDLLVSRTELYRHQLGSVEKKLDLSDYKFGLTVPVKFSEKGDLEGIDYGKIKVVPAFTQTKGENLVNKALGIESPKESEAAPAKVDPVEQAKQNIRATISSEMQAERKKSNADLYAYGSRLRDHMARSTSPELKSVVLQAAEDELKSIEISDFTDFQAELLNSKEGLATKLQKINAFEKNHRTVGKEDLNLLRDEVRNQAQSAGNTNTAAASGVQPQLEIGQAGDAYEKEADAMAEKVMQSSAGQRASLGGKEEEKIQKKPLVESITPIVQRKNEEEQRDDRSKADPSLESQLDETTGGGTPLPTATRQDMEADFGNDFSDVRVHTDSRAVQLSRQLGAKAFTKGQDLYFNANQYNPDSQDGKRLLAHELTHTIQQGKGVQQQAIQKVGEPPAASPTAAVSATPTTPVAAAMGVDTYTGPEGEININPSAKRVKIPLLSIPRVKRRFTPQSFTIPRTLQERIDQRQDWISQLQPFRGEIQAALDRKIADEGAPTTIVRNGVQMFFFKTIQSTEYVAGSKEQIIDRGILPNWIRSGERSYFDVDHKFELQLGGRNEVDNYWLLDASANRSSGSGINNEINAKLNRILTAARPTLGTHGNWPTSTRQIREGQFEIEIQNTQDNLPIAGRSDASRTWELAQIQRGEALTGLRALTANQLTQKGFLAGASITQMTLMSSSSGGSIHQIPVTEAEGRNGIIDKDVEIRMGRNFVITDIHYNQGTGTGSFTGAVFRSPDRAVIVEPATFNVGITRSDLVAFGGYINQSHLTQVVGRMLKARGMSPIELTESGLDFERGFYARGHILPTVPYLREGLSLDLIIDQSGISVEKTFSAGEINVPSPFRINDCSLTVRVGTGGWAISGGIDFEIERVGRGQLSGGVADGSPFIRGNFDFDSQLFSRARVGVEYVDNRFKVEGDLAIEPGKVRGIKTATAHVQYSEGTLAANGSAELDIRGIERGDLNLRYANHELTIGGNFLLSNEIPRIRGGQVAVSVTRRGENYEVSASGTAQPDIPGIDTTISVGYENGVLTIEGTVDYQRGIARGRIRVGATNRPVDENGRPTGLPGERWIIFGEGRLSLQLTPWLEATAGVQFSPTGELTVTGRIGLPNTVNVFNRRDFNRRLVNFPTIEIPLAAVPVGPRSIGLVATVGGGIDFNAGIGPGRLEELFGEITYSPGHEDSIALHGRGRFVIPVDAGLRLFGRLGIGLSAGVGRVTGNVELGASVGLQGAAEAEVDVNWDPLNGITLEATGRLYVEPVLRFDASVVGEAVVAVTESFELYRREWNRRLGQREFGSGLRYGVEFPVRYHEGEPFNISTEEIRVIRPEIDIGEAGRRFAGELFE